jgi:hypothetical protein
MASVKTLLNFCDCTKSCWCFHNFFSQKVASTHLCLWVSEGRCTVYEEICKKLDLSSFWKPVHMVIEAFRKLA